MSFERHHLLSWVLVAAPLAGLAGCAIGDESTEDAGVDSITSGLYGNGDYYWSGNPPMIAVCWENPGTGNISAPTFSISEATARTWVREAVEGQWSRYGRVNFTEWDTCSSGDAGVHIRINKTGNSSAPGGSTLDGVTDGVKLNLYYNDRSDCQASQANLQRCVQAIALHEFGHVLGFYHEEERPDYPGGTGACADQDWPNGDPHYYGAYDIDSVMSYCGQPGGDISTWKMALSPGDIASVQKAYGRRRAGQFVNARGADMLASNFLVAPGVFIWDGDEAAGQRWRYDFTNQAFRASSGSTTVCLDSFPGGTGVPMTTHACLHDSHQRFPLDDVYVRGFGGLCLDVPGGNTANGTQLQVWQCGAFGGSNQRWRIDTQNRIRFGSTNKCVTFSPVQGQSLFLHDCGAAPHAGNQSFLFGDSGNILFASSGSALFCADVEGPKNADYEAGTGLPHNGARVQAHDCRGEQLNQKWNLSGAFKNGNGKCVDVVNAGNGNGTGVQSYDCNGTIAQEWDYYFRQ